MRTENNLKCLNFGVGRSWGFISAIVYFCVMTCDGMSLTKQRLTPFKIKDLERGTYFKGNLMFYMIINIFRVVISFGILNHLNKNICICFSVLSDGSIKAQEAHSSLFQSSDVWFTACQPQNIIDSPSIKSKNAMSFDICQADERDEQNERQLVYDTINDYFKIITSVQQLREVCRKEGDRCHLRTMRAKIVDQDKLHVEIVPSINSSGILNVARAKADAPYGRISMVKRSRSRKGQTIMEIEM